MYVVDFKELLGSDYTVRLWEAAECTLTCILAWTHKDKGFAAAHHDS